MALNHNDMSNGAGLALLAGAAQTEPSGMQHVCSKSHGRFYVVSLLMQ